MPYLIGILASFGALAFFVNTRPAAFRLVRSRTIPAAPDAVFPLVNDFHEWAAWSPWEKVDADLAKTFEGPASGNGAIYRWSGKKTGAGSMTILDASAPAKIEIELAFLRPFKATNRTVFTFEPDGAGTKVTWEMTGERNFASKAFGLVMNMDDMVGKDFEKGLDALAAAVAAAKPASANAA